MEMTVPVMTMVKKFGGRTAAKEYAERVLRIHPDSWEDSDNSSVYPKDQEPCAKITRTVNNNAKLRWDPAAFPAAPRMIGM